MQEFTEKNVKEKLVREFQNSILIKLLKEGLITERQYKFLIR